MLVAKRVDTPVKGKLNVYEQYFLKLCEANNIKCEQQVKIKFWESYSILKTKGKKLVPFEKNAIIDFYLPDYKLYVEIKGFNRSSMQKFNSDKHMIMDYVVRNGNDYLVVASSFNQIETFFDMLVNNLLSFEYIKAPTLSKTIFSKNKICLDDRFK